MLMLITYVSSNIADYFVRKKVVPADDKDVIQYGVEITLSTAIGFLIVVLIGLAFGYVLESVVFLFLLCVVKENTGGYHASSYLTCNICTGSIFFTNILLYKYLTSLPPIIWFSFGLLSLVLICIFSPLENENHPLSDNQKTKAKRLSILTSALVFGLSLILYFIKQPIYSFIILVLATICINLIYGIIKRRNH